MQIIQSLIFEAANEYKVEGAVLLRLVESVNKQFSEAKKQEKKKKIDFGKFVETACNDERFDDMFVHKRYEQALGFYFGRKRGLKKKQALEWEVTRKDTRKVRVKVASKTSIEFRIVESHTWRGGRKVTFTTLDSPCFIHGEGPKEVDTLDAGLIELAEQRAHAWLKEAKRKAVG